MLSSGSGASHTNTMSTADDSSRLSAASTAPSSMEAHPSGDLKSPLDRPYDNIPVPPVPKSSAFSLKAAGRTFSFGRQKPPTPTAAKEEVPSLPASPATERNSPAHGRERAVTASSYASTATPSKFEDVELGGLNLGGDFSDMFGALAKRKSAVMDVEAIRGLSRSPVSDHGGIWFSLILYKADKAKKERSTEANAMRSYGSGRPNQPSRLNLDNNEPIEPPPHSWTSYHSDERLMSNATPPPPPQHGIPRKDYVPNSPREQRPGSATNSVLTRGSPTMGRTQAITQQDGAVDEDARILRESVIANRRLNDNQAPKVRESWLSPVSSPNSGRGTIGSRGQAGAGSSQSARNVTKMSSEDDMFDSSIAASVNLAERFQEHSAAQSIRDSMAGRAMTAAQFERYKEDRERMINLGDRSSEDDEDEPTYEDEEDDAEKKKELAKQRRKQEAHMAVYRQQMMKVTGEPIPPLRPMSGSQSSPNLPSLATQTAADDGEEDEEVPLAILQAHGFPTKSKPPMQNRSSNPNLRASMLAGGGVATSSNLPVFARKLPEDPYFGASVVNPSYRESLSFHAGAGSVNGAPAQPPAGGPAYGVPPGGLVGVIAGEERARSLRRGSPNPQGEYPAVPGGFGGMMGRTPPAGNMNPMMLSPGDQAQIVMTHQMQQFMNMQLQFMQMMAANQGGGAAMSQQPPSEYQRPVSQNLNQNLSPNMNVKPPRAMTMMDPSVGANWFQSGYAPSVNGNGGGYAPSIAPSERSNVGLPGRYRPVSQVQPVDAKSRASTMSGALQNWDKQAPASSKLAKQAANADDDDDDQGWEEMAKKREKKRSLWRKNKDNNALKEVLNFASN